MLGVEIVVLGEINPDIVVRARDPRPAFGQGERIVDEIVMTVGSSSAIFACGVAKLGLRVSLVGVVGDDPFGHFMLEALIARNVDVSSCRMAFDIPTGASVILSGPEDRAILTAPGTIPALRAADVPRSLLRAARHIHVGSYFLLDSLRPAIPDLFDEARIAGLSTSLDVNWDPRGTWDDGLRDALRRTDVFLPNETEALRITGAGDVEQAALDLVAAGARLVIVKLGAAGALVASSDGILARTTAIPVQPVDTTGAGDSFDAGFLAAWLRGQSPANALEFAVACGSLSTQAVGGTGGQPTFEEATAAAARLAQVNRANADSSGPIQ